MVLLSLSRSLDPCTVLVQSVSQSQSSSSFRSYRGKFHQVVEISFVFAAELAGAVAVAAAAVLLLADAAIAHVCTFDGSEQTDREEKELDGLTGAIQLADTS